jgi:DMSO/TMAO reductase YedYZ molybdopterin-dependent catalytic subunit
MTGSQPDQPTRKLDRLPLHPGPERSWTGLVIGGLVRRPTLMTAADLADLPRMDVTTDFVCREGWCVPGLHWEGVALATLLDLAEADPTAPWIEVAAEGFATPLARDAVAGAMIATHLGGAPLAVEHGGPARLVIPGADCYTSIKWLDRIEVLDTASRDVAREVALARLARAASTP